MSLDIFIIAFGVACLALVATIFWRSTRQHFHARSECNRVIGLDGKERDSWSFTSGHSNTLIGRTIGRIYIAAAHAKHERIVSKFEADRKA